MPGCTFISPGRKTPQAALQMKRLPKETWDHCPPSKQDQQHCCLELLAANSECLWGRVRFSLETLFQEDPRNSIALFVVFLHNPPSWGPIPNNNVVSVCLVGPHKRHSSGLWRALAAPNLTLLLCKVRSVPIAARENWLRQTSQVSSQIRASFTFSPNSGDMPQNNGQIQDGSRRERAVPLQSPSD